LPSPSVWLAVRPSGAIGPLGLQPELGQSKGHAHGDERLESRRLVREQANWRRKRRKWSAREKREGQSVLVMALLAL